jgi:hypothetical protein
MVTISTTCWSTENSIFDSGNVCLDFILFLKQIGHLSKQINQLGPCNMEFFIKENVKFGLYSEKNSKINEHPAIFCTN